MMTLPAANRSSATRRLLVTGGHGFVAGSIIRQADPRWEVHVLSRGPALLQRDGVCWHQIESGDAKRLAQLMDEVRPSAMIHAAALADIDYCENHPDEANAVNVELTRTLVELCAAHGGRLVFCSTDSVFDGEHAPYDEDAAPEAVNAYAETKIQAERIVASLGGRAVIARLALVVGLPALAAGNSFLPKLLADLGAGREVRAPANEFRTPVDVITLGRALLELAGGSHSGIFHLSGNDSVNRFELGRRIARRFGLPAELIVASDSSQIRGRARRSRDVSLNNAKARMALTVPMLGLDHALDLILESALLPNHE
jgi:dTDP-4-dehydrorhamnose reductase